MLELTRIGPVQPWAHRSISWRFLLREATGALGDIGTFVPLAVGMVQVAGLDASTLLVTAGAVNIWGGLAFRVPVAVQPMEAICALAIAGALSGTQAIVAGISAGIAIGLLGAFGMLRRIADLVPDAVLRALQFTVACELLVRGLRFVATVPGHSGETAASAILPLVMTTGVISTLWLLRRRVEWLAIGLLALGFGLAAWQNPSLLVIPRPALWAPRLVHFDLSAVQGVWLGGLPQLPLTLLNSVFAVTALAAQLYPQQAWRCTAARVAVSVGLMNLLVCPLGGMPLCHGSGGLAGQHKLGARSGLSVVFLGTVKLCFGLLLGGFALKWMMAFPQQILGVFLMLAGWSLAEASLAWTSKSGVYVSAAMVAVSLGSGLLLAAFGAGWLVWWCAKRWERAGAEGVSEWANGRVRHN